MICFTRLLYCYDEVKINLLLTILSKDLNTSIFWLVEIHQSGFTEELINHLWKIYYDFFALQTSFSTLKYKNDIIKYRKTNNIIFLINFLNKLIQSKYTFDIFIMRMFYKERNGISNLTKKNYVQLLERLYNDINRPEFMYRNLKIGKSFYTDSKLIKIVEKIKNNKKFKNNEYYGNLHHKLLVYLYNSTLKIKKSEKRIKKETIDLVNKHMNFDKTKSNNENFREKREYYISNMTSCFELERNNMDKPLTEYFWGGAFPSPPRDYWLYYAKDTPFWKSKLSEYEHIIDDETKEVLFKSESCFNKDDNNAQQCNNCLECFMEKYSYDLDELDFITRDVSTMELNNNNNLEQLLLLVNEKSKLILNLSINIDFIKNKY